MLLSLFRLTTDDNDDDERGWNKVSVGNRGVKGGPPPQFGVGLGGGGGPLHEFGRGGGPSLDMSKTYGRGGFQQVGSGGGRGFSNFNNFGGSGSGGSGSFGDSPDTGSPGAGPYGGGGGFFGGVDEMNQSSEDSPEQAYTDEVGLVLYMTLYLECESNLLLH